MCSLCRRHVFVPATGERGDAAKCVGKTSDGGEDFFADFTVIWNQFYFGL